MVASGCACGKRVCLAQPASGNAMEPSRAKPVNDMAMNADTEMNPTLYAQTLVEYHPLSKVAI